MQPRSKCLCPFSDFEHPTHSPLSTQALLFHQPVLTYADCGSAFTEISRLLGLGVGPEELQKGKGDGITILERIGTRL